MRKAAETLYSDSLYISSGALARKTEKLAKEIWKPAGVPPSHGHLLLLVMHHTIILPSMLARELFLSPSTVTRLVEKLEKMDLVSRSPYDHLTCVVATEKAWKLEPLLCKCMLDFERRCRKILGDDKVPALTLLINETTDQLTGSKKGGRKMSKGVRNRCAGE